VKRETRGKLGQREMAITQGRLPFVFGILVLATLLIAAPEAHAACSSPKNICKHFDDCLQRTSDPNTKDADGIDPPPLKWSDLRYVFDIKEDCNGKEAIQA
jgi:hypothetical protein